MIYQKLTPEGLIVPALCFVRGSHADNFSYSIQYGEKKKKLEEYGEVKTEFEELIHISPGEIVQPRMNLLLKQKTQKFARIVLMR